ncbi:hypothetical protein KSS87_022209, partial [Heliosperma pusillum]
SFSFSSDTIQFPIYNESTETQPPLHRLLPLESPLTRPRNHDVANIKQHALTVTKRRNNLDSTTSILCRFFADVIDNVVVGVDELPRLRVAELKCGLHRYDLSIKSTGFARVHSKVDRRLRTHRLWWLSEME